jgi:hypothetical protein
MLQDGMVLMQGSTANMEGSAVKGLALESGSAFPLAPTDGQKFRLTAATADYEAGEYSWSVADSEWTNIFVQLAKNPNFNASGKKGSVVEIDQGTSVPYDIGMQILSKPDANAVVGSFIAVRPFSLVDNFAGSLAKAKIAPAASMIFTIMRNAETIGTLTFLVGQRNGVFSAGTNLKFVAGDEFSLVAPAAQDSAFTEGRITFVGKL